jgi:hypothetical protein
MSARSSSPSFSTRWMPIGKLIVANSTPDTAALQRETRTIPIVRVRAGLQRLRFQIRLASLTISCL